MEKQCQLTIFMPDGQYIDYTINDDWDCNDERVITSFHVASDSKRVFVKDQNGLSLIEFYNMPFMILNK